MRNNLLLSLAFVLMASFAMAQGTTISGRVTSASDGSSLPGVNVVVKGTTNGTVTDIDGNYRLSVTDGETLVFSFIGLESMEVAIGSRSVIDAAMTSDVKQLGEVVVTAMGVEKQRDQLGYTSTTVGGETLSNSGEPNLLNSMKGKVAGVNITEAGGDPGAGARITIRGATSINGSLQPLIVIDGVPMYNSTGNSSTGSVTGQSRLNDLNPADIESMEVLKGASAAALWGSRAANGVIMIATKQGSTGSRPFTISFSSRAAYDVINKEVPLQTKYGQGINSRYDGGFGASSGNSSSWGDIIADRSGGTDNFITDPAAAGYQGYFESDVYAGKTYYAVADGDNTNPHGGKNNRTVYDPYEALFKTGTAFTNSVSVGSNTENGNVFLSFSNLTQDGIIKTNSTYERNTARVNATRYLGEKVTATLNLSYTRSNSDRVNKGSNISGLLLGGLRNAPDFDQSDYQGTYFDANGIPNADRQRAYRNPLGRRTNSTYDNARWLMDNVLNTSIVDRLLGKFELGYDATEWLNFTGRVGFDSFTDSQDRYYDELSATANGGSFGKYVDRRTQLQMDFLVRAQHVFSDVFSGNILLGVSTNQRKRDWTDAEINGFTNLSSPPNLTNAAANGKVTDNGYTFQRNMGYYGTIGLDIANQVFVNLTGRMDAYSTFSEADNTFFYPAVDVAWQFSKILPTSNAFSFGKLRANWGQVGRAPNPYVTTTNFVPGGYSDGWVPGLEASSYGGGYRRSSAAGNPNIAPEIKTELEVGADLRFVNNRIRFGITYYDNVTTDLIIPVDVAESSGFSSITANAAEIANQGLEIELGASIIESNNGFRWDLSANYAHNRNQVVSLAGADQIILRGFTSAGSYAVVGEQYGAIFGARWDRDENTGALNLDSDGFPFEAATPGVIGDPNPTYTIGMNNNFSYKNFSLNILLETVQGADVWNGTRGAVSFFGRYGDQDYETTLSAADAQSLKIWTGATVADYYSHKENSDGTYTVRGYVEDFGAGDVFVEERFVRSGPGSGFTGPSETFVEETSWVRLRDVSLSYNFASMFNDGLFSDFSLTVSGRNLGLWTDYMGVDPDTNLTGASNGFGLDYFNNPSTQSYIVTLNITY